MVRAIPNLTRLSGTIVAKRSHPTLRDWDLVTLAVEEAAAVAGQADLLSRHVGARLDVAVPRAVLGEATSGAHLRVRAKMTPDGAMAESHPAPGDASVDRDGSNP